MVSSVLYSVEWYRRLLSSLALCVMWLYTDVLGISGESSCGNSSVGFSSRECCEVSRVVTNSLSWLLLVWLKAISYISMFRSRFQSSNLRNLEVMLIVVLYIA